MTDPTIESKIIGFRNKGTNEVFKDASSMVLDAQKRYKELMDLTYCDIECVVKEPDESCWLILDECGNWNYFPDDQYEIIFAEKPTLNTNSMYLITAEERDEILNSLPPEKVVEILDRVRSRKVPENGGAQAAIERERWYHRLNGILKTAKFYDQVDTMLQEVVKEMEEESASSQSEQEPDYAEQCKSCERETCYFNPKRGVKEKGLGLDSISIPVFIDRFGCAKRIPQQQISTFTLPKDTTNLECINEGLKGLSDYFNAALEGEESKAALRRMWDQQIGILFVLLKKEFSHVTKTDLLNKLEKEMKLCYNDNPNPTLPIEQGEHQCTSFWLTRIAEIKKQEQK